MDLTPGTPSPKSPETDTDTETPLQIHLTKALSLTNGSFKPHRRTQPSPPPPQQMVVVSYKECLKNHACTLGGLALDGCGEFMPTHSTATPLDSSSLKCAACGCHRNFHRRDCNPTTTTYKAPPPPIHRTSGASPGSTSSGPSPSPTSPASPTPQSFYSSAPHMLLALSTGHSVPLDENHYPHPPFNLMAVNPSGKKRQRTKFTAEQKEKMQAFAEKLRWKMVRGDEDRIMEKFCSEVGVKREVFKVWMHNNKSRREKGAIKSISYDFNSTNKCDANGNIEGRVTSDTDAFDTTTYDSYDRFQTDSKLLVHGCHEGSSPSC